MLEFAIVLGAVKHRLTLTLSGAAAAMACPLALLASASASEPPTETGPCCSLSQDRSALTSNAGQKQLDPEKLEETRIAKWTEFLSAIAVTEDVCLVAPITTKNLPPSPFKRAYGEATLEMLRYVMGARASVEEGTVALRAVLGLPESAKNSGSSWISEWVSTATDAEISAAISAEGFSLGSMDVSDRLQALSKIGLTQDVIEGFVANGDESKLHVRFTVDVKGTDASGKPIRYSIEPTPLFRPPVEDSPVTTYSRIAADSFKQRSGELDFGTGQVLTAKALQSAVFAKLEKTFSMDPRLDGSYIFVAGKYSFDQLLAAVRYALDVPLVQSRQVLPELSDAEVASLIEQRLASLLSGFTDATGIDARWAMERRTMSASVLAEKDAGFKRYLQERGFNASSIMVTLTPTVGFQASAPGQTKGISPDPSIPASTHRHNFALAYHPRKG